MAHVVTEACVRCRYTDCVEVCPVDAFHVGPKMLVIGEECIDCGLCIGECGPKAIYPEDNLPKNQQVFKSLNMHWSRRWPVLTRKQKALDQAKHWESIESKRDQIPELFNTTPEETDV